jgi:hypothetical protein
MPTAPFANVSRSIADDQRGHCRWYCIHWRTCSDPTYVTQLPRLGRYAGAVAHDSHSATFEL